MFANPALAEIMQQLLSRKRHDSTFGSNPPPCMEPHLGCRLRLGSSGKRFACKRIMIVNFLLHKD